MSILNSSIVPVGSTGGYSIDNSLRFNDDDSAYLNKTFASAGTEETWTFSCWHKLGSSTSGMLLFAGTSSTDRFQLYYCFY